MPSEPRPTERLSFRLEPEMKRVIERAAAARGLSLTDFAVQTLVREAQEVLRMENVLVLSDADRDAFLKALDDPAPPTSKMLRAAERFKAARASGEIR